MQVPERIRELAAKDFDIDPEGLDRNTPFDELKIDSLAFIEFLFKIEEEFGVSLSDKEVRRIDNLTDLERCVAAALAKATR